MKYVLFDRVPRLVRGLPNQLEVIEVWKTNYATAAAMFVAPDPRSQSMQRDNPVRSNQTGLTTMAAVEPVKLGSEMSD